MWRCFFVKLTVRDLVLMALYAALFIVLDYVSHFLPKMPNGGSLGLGVIPILMASYHLGARKGILVGLLSVILQFLTGQMYYIHWLQFFLDYILAYGIYGVAVLMPNFGHIYTGVIITNLIRLASSTIAGVIFYSEAGAKFMDSFLFSLNYNATYMIPTLIVCAILVPILQKRLHTFMK